MDSTINSAKKKPRRDAQVTQNKLLAAATEEFCDHGYEGARIDRIVKQAGCNIRMLYHYFNDKEGLYLAVLEQIYATLRDQEQSLQLDQLSPTDAMLKLIDFTFDYMLDHPDFIAMVRNENLLAGRMLEKLPSTIAATTPLISMIETLLSRGVNTGVFRAGIDAKDLYLTLVSLSITHLAHRHTLSRLFQQDLSSQEWLVSRKQIVEEVILSYLSKR